MLPKQKLSVFWFRRDLRLDDNTALYHALMQNSQVLPVFIFDENITEELPLDDKRILFIYKSLLDLNKTLNAIGSHLWVKKGRPLDVFKVLCEEFDVEKIYLNRDYEPYAIERDLEVSSFALQKGIPVFSYKDQVIFEKNDILKNDGSPYTVFTPYSRKWIEKLNQSEHTKILNTQKYFGNFYKCSTDDFPKIEQLGFKNTHFPFPPNEININKLIHYESTRNFPALDATTRLSLHLRFGTVGIRSLVNTALIHSKVWLNELIWREFFMMILFHFPHVQNHPFKAKYKNIEWLSDHASFEAWCRGETGYPIVDAGMRELNNTGFMHNRVRMIAAGFLVKHLLINWQWGEHYFAQNLIDYELASNNGNWQWSAGTGCDAAPYFRIFNPITQAEKYDRNNVYINKWVKELNSSVYPKPIINHEFARKRCIETYKRAIS